MVVAVSGAEAGVEVEDERLLKKVASETIRFSGSQEALRASSPLVVVEEREELEEYRPCGENEGHRMASGVM